MQFENYSPALERHYEVFAYRPAPRQFATIFTDITPRKQSEKILKERTAELEEANKELESFSYTISHDLRAPLRSIDGFTRMLMKSHQDLFDDEARRKFQVIRENAQKMGQLIDDLLAFSRSGRQKISLSILDMEKMIEEVWHEQCALNPDRRMEMHTDRLPEAFGDRTLIKQVLINLLANAVKFSSVREDPRIETGGYREGSECVYYVRDNGVGFDMQYADKLFGVFQRLHDAEDFEGTGVGLAIVQRIVQRHGGRVWAEARENEGATFYFSLPASNI